MRDPDDQGFDESTRSISTIRLQAVERNALTLQLDALMRQELNELRAAGTVEDGIACIPPPKVQSRADRANAAQAEEVRFGAMEDDRWRLSASDHACMLAQLMII